MILAHIAGVPVEEALLPALTGATAAGLLIARARIALRSHLPPRRRAATPTPPDLPPPDAPR